MDFTYVKWQQQLNDYSYSSFFHSVDMEETSNYM